TVPATSTVTLDGEESDALQAVKVGEKGLSSTLPQVPKACASPSPAPANEAVAKTHEMVTGAQSAGQTLLNAVPPVENGEAVIVLDSPAKGAVKSGLETLLQEIVSKTATPQPESLREPGAQEPVKSVNPSIPVTTAQPVSGASGSESATAQFAFQTGSMERLDETVGASPVGRPTMQTLGDFTVRSVRYLVTNEETAMTVRLIPPSLGELRLHVTTSGDVVNVHIVSASPAVRDALNGDLAALREALNRGGIGIGQMSVSAGMTRDSGHGSTPYTQSGLDAAVAARRAQAVPAVAAVLQQRGAGHQGTLNLFM
ncbi:MAG: flagellar hook-length control protein FliK, partial [Candidatus Hydrogenedentes bacterium]|nr:flagellar hook-length control protein FliK [Candidatus Hydrogenedentota bacterium]